MGRDEPSRAEAISYRQLVRDYFFKYRPLFVLRLSRKEAAQLLDALEVWIEGYRQGDIEDEEVVGLFDGMSTAVDIRNKLWKEVMRRDRRRMDTTSAI